MVPYNEIEKKTPTLMQTFYILVCITTPPSLPQKQKSTHPNSHTCEPITHNNKI